MKKEIVLIFSVLIFTSFFVVANNDNENLRVGVDAKTGVSTNYNNSETKYEIREGQEINNEEEKNIIRVENRLRVNNQNKSECPSNCSCSESTTRCEFSDENGTRRELTIHAGNSGNIIVQVKGINASTNVTLYKSDGRVYGIFKNNETKEVILPDEAKARIESRIRLKLHNESINLTEEGVYEVRARKESRLLWTIPVRERVRAEINAETGEITKTRGSSWWGFLAKDIEEEA